MDLKTLSLVAVTQDGLALAQRVADHLAAGEATRPEVFGEELRALFCAGRGLVAVCATGIAVRALAPVIGEKGEEPPVVILSEDGSVVVPLLGGHRGANALAKEIAAFLGVTAAITTAGDLHFCVALDAPPPGWVLANPGDYKSFAARLLADKALMLVGEADWLQQAALPFVADAALKITVSEKAVAGGPNHLVYHPQRFVLGLGCARGAKTTDMAQLVKAVLAEAQVSAKALAGLTSIDLKMDETGLLALARDMNLPLHFFTAAALEKETPRLATPSERVFVEVGCHGVAEASALAAVGAKGCLRVAKQKNETATAALAECIDVLAHLPGVPQGRLYVVGTGPGKNDWMTPAALKAVNRASDLVGYGLYLDLLGAHAKGKKLHAFPLGEEEVRVAHALDLASQGKTVALVSSGDPGIYAMATLVFELMARGDKAAWQRVAVEVEPGLSAMQAAAALSGAPLGHDFCTISLSDLLTPWEVIERRLQAAADGDFVVAFYNPVSQRRTWQLGRARELLMAARGGSVPVVLGRQLGRPEEAVTITTLAELDPSKVDMLTLVLVGSSESQVLENCGGGGRRVFTPRGYAGKATTQNSRAQNTKIKKAAS